MLSIDERIHRLARLGLVSRDRLLDAGISDDAVRMRLARGSLRLVHPGVYATFGRQLDVRARLLAACLASGPGTVASHRAALWMWDLLDEEPAPEITAPRSSHPRPQGVILHRPNELRPVDVVVRRGVPVTNPMRSLLDAGAVLPRPVVGACIEKALEARLVTVKGLRVVLADLGGRGRAGTAALRDHLDRRALGDARPESVLEPLMARLIYRDLGIGPVEYQKRLRLDGQEVRPDFLVSMARTAVEVDGLSAHGTREALDRDLARQNLLIRHGYLVLRYTRTHLRRPAKVAAEIIEVCQRRIDELARLAS